MGNEREQFCSNQLSACASLYLRRHADDPVWWRIWNDATFERAVRLDRPILLSIGYSACHWCHVMATESFADPATASLMNDLFVCIKLDREERPDLDRHFLAEMGRMGRPTGWPMTLFLTPAGRLVDGGGYYPREPRFGLPAFSDVLRRMEAACRASGGQTEHLPSARATRHAQLPGSDGVADGLLDHVCRALLDGLDPLYGGFGQDGPKFLHPAGHELLLRAWRRTGKRLYLDAVSDSVARIVDSAVFDHIGGGFHRYAADDCWSVPHFEKMLNDNALMIRLCTHLWQATRRPLFADRVAATIAWLLREMRSEDGGLCASAAADTPDGEGAFYLWTAEELRTVLGSDCDAFLLSFDATPQPTCLDRLALSRRQDFADSSLRRDPTPQLALLAHARRSRALPLCDEACLADWSGQAVTALAEAGLAFNQPEWIEAASEVFDATLSQLQHGVELSHHAGRSPAGAVMLPGSIGLLDDYAAMIEAALTLHEATGEPDLLRRVADWDLVLERDYWDPAAGAYFLTSVRAEQRVARQTPIDEAASSAGNGIMLGVLARLFGLTGDARYRQRFNATINRYGAAFTRAPLQVATALCHSQALDRLVQITLVGATGPLRSLRRCIHQTYLPDLLVILGDDVPADMHPGHGETAPAGGAMAYICQGQSCRPPVGDVVALEALLFELTDDDDLHEVHRT